MAAPADPLTRLEALSREVPELAHTFSFMVGAVYSLREARARGHRDRADYAETDRADHLRRLHAVVAALSDDGSPQPVWIAGFYYNSAIMRIDACYERFLKAMLEAAGATPERKAQPRQSKTSAWAKQVERLLSLDPPIARQHLEWARTEVNKLKHDLYGRLPAAIGRQHLDVANAEAAVNELIGLMERPDIKSRLSERFRSLPPP